MCLKCLRLLHNLLTDDQPRITGLNSFADILSTLVLVKISNREIFPSGFFLMKELTRIKITYVPKFSRLMLPGDKVQVIGVLYKNRETKFKS